MNKEPGEIAYEAFRQSRLHTSKSKHQNWITPPWAEIDEDAKNAFRAAAESLIGWLMTGSPDAV